MKRSSRLRTNKYQLIARYCLPFSIYWPTDSIREVVVYSTLSLPAYCSSSVPLIWNEAFCSPYFSVSTPCKGKTHSGNIINGCRGLDTFVCHIETSNRKSVSVEEIKKAPEKSGALDGVEKSELRSNHQRKTLNWLYSNNKLIQMAFRIFTKPFAVSI